MVAISPDALNDAPSTETPFEVRSARRYMWRYVLIYVIASGAAVLVTLFLCLLGLSYDLNQWIFMLAAASFFVIPGYTLPDVWVLIRHYRPIGEVLETIDRGERPNPHKVSRAIV